MELKTSAQAEVTKNNELMKKLILVRHGKSSWEYSVSDRDRPLSERGINDALLVSGKVLSQNIETASFNGADLGARQNMLLGACLAGQAFANAPVAAVHALAYPLGGHFHIPHGLSNALVLPHVLRFNEDHAFELYAALTPCLIKDIKQDQDPLALSQIFISQLESLIEHLKLPNKLHMLGIESADLTRLAEDAMLQTRLLENNPKPLAFKDALNIYQQAF